VEAEGVGQGEAVAEGVVGKTLHFRTPVRG